MFELHTHHMMQYDTLEQVVSAMKISSKRCFGNNMVLCVYCIIPVIAMFRYGRHVTIHMALFLLTAFVSHSL